MIPECPPALQQRLGDGPSTPFSRPPQPPSEAAADPTEAWVDHTGGGEAWLVADHLVRHHPTPGQATAEAERRAWLADALDTPNGSGDDGTDDDPGGTPDADGAGADLRVVSAPSLLDGAWTLTTVPDGAPAHRPDRHPRPDSLPARIGTALARLHALDPASCPFTRPMTLLVEEVRAAIDDGRLVIELLPTPYDRYPAERLLEMIDSAPTRDPDPVVAHGAPLLANIWPSFTDDGATLIGLHHLGAAERAADLAVIHRQLQDGFGPEAVFAFYETYGRDPDLVALDRHLLIDAVRSAIVA